MFTALKSNLAWIMGAAIIIGLMIAGSWLYHHGKSVASLECDRKRKEAIELAVEEAKRDWESQQTITSNGIQNVNNTKERIVYIERKAETISAPLCSDLGSDYGSVYNEAIRTIKEGADTSRNLSTSKMSGSSFDGNAKVNPNKPSTAVNSSQN